DALGNSIEGGCNMLRVVSAGWIIVANNHHVGAAEAIAVFGTPLPGPSWVTCRDQLLGAQSLYVLLALHHVNDFIKVNRDPQLGQAVESSARLTHRPNPPTAPIWSALAEILGVKPHYLKQQVALFINVGVRREDAELVTPVQFSCCIDQATLDEPVDLVRG